MTRSSSSRPVAELADKVRASLVQGRRVRERVGDEGLLHLDRRLPFLLLYRPAERVPHAESLIQGEAAFLQADPHLRQEDLAHLVEVIVETCTQETGAFLVLEIWPARPRPPKLVEGEAIPPPPSFRVRALSTPQVESAVASLAKSLGGLKVNKVRGTVSVERTSRPYPRGRKAVLPREKRKRLRCSWVGIEVDPIWWNPAHEEDYPLARRVLARKLSRALRQACFEFTRTETPHRPQHYHVLGPHGLVKSVWKIDGQLAEIDRQLDPVLYMTPVNVASAFSRFRAREFAEPPRFLYRPLPVDPDALMRKLYQIRLDRVQDNTLAYIFRQKRNELRRRLTLLSERDSRRALYSSLQLYGRPDTTLLASSRWILQQISPGCRERGGRSLTAEEFAAEARACVDSYRQDGAEWGRVEVRDDIGATMMVSRGTLYVGREFRVPASRVRALIAHEVETHILTHRNGQAQRLRLLDCGTDGYEELQEGLAVLCEYLVGGLSRARLRTLAARVVASDVVARGGSFVSCFETLHSTHGFSPEPAFTITMRVFRGGGFVKDLIYLRGLLRLLRYLEQGGDIEPLWIGKISEDDILLVSELRRRRILRPPPLRPHFLDEKPVRRRLAALVAEPTLERLLRPPR